MLTLKPNCECCDKDLPASSTEAMICSYECTFCKSCVQNVLINVCPNCGGGFVPRPIRPKVARRPGTSIEHQPASTIRVNTRYSMEELQEFAQLTKDIAADER